MTSEEITGKDGGKSQTDSSPEIEHSIKSSINPEKITVKAGGIVLKEGEYSPYAYRVLKGLVEVYRKGRHGNVTIARIGENSIFGEMSLIDQKPHSATVVAVTDVILTRIDSDFYQHELQKSSPDIREIMLIFNERLRKATQDIVFRRDAELVQRKITEMSREELQIMSHISYTSIHLQKVFEWDEAYTIMENSLKTLGFEDIEVDIYEKRIDENDYVKLIQQEEDGDRYQLFFQGKNRSGSLSLFAPTKKHNDKYKNVLLVYNSLLASCMIKYESFKAFKTISQQVEKYIADTRIQEVSMDLKKAIEKFSSKNLDLLMSIPDRLTAGENIEDISFELTMEFQEIDRLIQEVDLIQSVFRDILQIAQGQTPENNESYDKDIDKLGDQSFVDDIFQNSD